MEQPDFDFDHFKIKLEPESGGTVNLSLNLEMVDFLLREMTAWKVQRASRQQSDGIAREHLLEILFPEKYP